MTLDLKSCGLIAEAADGRMHVMMTVFDDVNGQIVAKEGTANLTDDYGKPVTLLMEAAWQTVDAKTLLDAMTRGTVYDEKEIPVKQYRGGYDDGVSARGYLVELTPEDQVAFGATDSRAHRVVNGELQTLTGVIAITRDAYCLIQEKTNKLKVKERFTPQPATKPISTGNLLESIAFVRVKGPVMHETVLTNGTILRKEGGLAGNQRELALEAMDAEARKLAEQRTALSPFANLKVEVIEPAKSSGNRRVGGIPVRRR